MDAPWIKCVNAERIDIVLQTKDTYAKREESGTRLVFAGKHPNKAVSIQSIVFRLAKDFLKKVRIVLLSNFIERS